MSDDFTNNETTQPLKRTSEETQPIHLGESGKAPQAEPVAPERKESKIPEEIFTPPPATGYEARPKVNPETNGSEPVRATPQPKKKGRGCLILAGFIVILAGAALGGYLGYGSGLQDRIDRQSSQVAMTAATQFQLGLDDLNGERYDLARTRFEYVIKLEPNFPGIQEKLAQTIIEMSRTEVPTETPTLTLTPTPDMRGEQDLFNQIQQNLVAKNWDAAIQAIETLRAKNLTFHTVDVDGMYYIALRYRGVDRILRSGDLEGGMYDLALAQRFGPLDRDADNYRLYARYYQIGASFWEVDWEKAMNYFGQVAPYLPMLRDSSMIAAIDRYHQASIAYAAKVISDNDFCKADKILSEILANNYRNATAEPMATRAYRECHPPTETPQPTQTASVSPTVTATRLTPAVTTPVVKTATLTPPGAATATQTVAGPTATNSGSTPTSTATAMTTATLAATSQTPVPPTAAATATSAVAPSQTPVPPTATTKP